MSAPRTSTAPVLAVAGLTAAYHLPHGQTALALDDVSFHLDAGEILGVVGESGCGKSTLLLSLMRLLPANGEITRGCVRLLGQDVLALDEAALADVRGKQIAMIFQGAMNALNPVQTVGRQLREPMVRHRIELDPTRTLGSQVGGAVTRHGGLGKGSGRDRRVAELLNLVGIPPSRQGDYPHQFSGGMRQRVMIAMALACEPRVIMADEPTTALDVIVQAQILDLILHLREQLGLAVILVTHDLGVVAEVCDRVMVMYAGVVAETGTVDQVYTAPRHPYTQQLLAAFPTLERRAGRLASIPGAPPQLDDLPRGCRFAPRCPHCFGPCQTAPPPLYPVSAAPGHAARCYLLEAAP